jgi:hypothetical protein
MEFPAMKRALLIVALGAGAVVGGVSLALHGATSTPATVCQLDYCGDERGIPSLSCYCKVIDGHNECFATAAECQKLPRAVRAPHRSR